MIHKDTKQSLAIKGWLGAAAALIAIASYIVYYIYYYKGIKLDELYFISTGLSISIFTGILFTMFENKSVRTFLIFATIFYAILIITYTIHWWMTGLPYAYIEISLTIGFIAGLIYYAYDTISHARNNAKNRRDGTS